MQNTIILITLLILLLTAAMVVKYRRNIKGLFLILSIGLVTADTVMLVLVNSISYQEKGASLGIVSVLTALQIGTLDAAYQELFALLESIQSLPLMLLFYITSVLTPICFAGCVLSLFRSLSGIFKYLVFSPTNNVYYFSSLNEKSCMLAKDICKNEKKALVVFCGIPSGEENELITKAVRQGFIISKKNIEEFVRKTKKSRYYFILGENDSDNLKTAQMLIAVYTQNKKITNYENVKIYLRCELVEAELLMDARCEKQISVIFINEAVAAANELLFNYPLYSVLNKGNQNKISVLLLGAGNVGDKLLKLACSVMQMGKNYSTEITVADFNAKRYKSVLQTEAPELVSDEYKINFEDIDIETVDFEKFLDEKCLDVNYIAVCMGNDDKNLRIALRLRAYYLRKNFTNTTLPFIGVRIKDGENCQNILGLMAGNQSFNLTAFGSYRNVYSYEIFVNSELEKIALNVHAAYQYEEGKRLTYGEILKSFNRSEQDRKSNRANAIHIRYKLFTLGYGIKKKSLASYDEIENSRNFVRDLCNKLNDETVLDELSKLEHERWNAHERSAGWRFVSVEDAQKYEPLTNNHKNICAKLHPCICSWDELDAVSEAYGKDFKFYDTKIVKVVPEILGLTSETSINVSGTEYLLIKL